MNQIPEEQILPSQIISKLFPVEVLSLSLVAEKYPLRNLDEGAMITRLGPSPTGFMHIGSLYTALISERLAKQTGGVFFLRIEDTDQARKIEGAEELIVASLENFGIAVHEGLTSSGEEIGAYGPYRQSERKNIYQSAVKTLLERGLAYPCFATPEEIEENAKKQTEIGIRPGYYGKWALWRDASVEKIEIALSENLPYVIRFRSNGDFSNKIKVHDLLKGNLELSENDQDRVILKSSTGLPTYHLAHVVDDHFMGTTHVLRGDEWLSSLPLHLELFDAFGWTAPLYGHLAPIQKMEDLSKRKISKRKDPEADAMLYKALGYPEDSIVEYLLNLANSNFEDWRRENLAKNNREFTLTLERLAHSNGPLFDVVKLNDISKEIISRMSASEIYGRGLVWAESFNTKLAWEMKKNPDYTKAILNIEREGESRPRKDIAKWDDLETEIGYFFDVIFDEIQETRTETLAFVESAVRESVIKEFLDTYNENDSKDEWFEKIKIIAKNHGYAEGAKAYKLEPQKYKGQVGDVAKIFRVLLTGKTNTPDLYSLMKVMGKERVFGRITNV